MKRLKMIGVMALFLMPLTVAYAANPTTMSWTAPTTNTDGTPLIDLAGYNAYCGAATGTYTVKKNVGNVTSVLISSIVTTNGTYYCVVTALDTSGNESSKSNEISFLLDTLVPAAPTFLKVQ